MRAFFRATLFAFALLSFAACGSDTPAPVATETGASTPADTNGETAMAEEMAMGDDEHAHAHGGGIEVPASMTTPEITIGVSADPVSGQNLQITLADFEIAPQSASTEPVDGQGHMHLYVDGERQMRFYNTSVHLELDPGEHLVEVEVSANNHSAYLVDGTPIRSGQSIVVPEPAGSHDHSAVVTSNVDWSPAPSVSLTVTEDPASGWNIHAVPKNFTLSPEGAGKAVVDGDGHMHLYVNGTKITRLYGEWWHLSSLPSGEVEVSVELNGNDHQALTVDGAVIGDAVVVVNEAAEAAMDEETSMDAAVAAVPEGAIVVIYRNGELSVDQSRYTFTRGDTISMVFDADTDELHVHGYDLHLAATPGSVAQLDFEATIPGLFEVELEDSGDFVIELQVES